MSFSIRQFRPDQVSAYKSLRLEALREEPGNYGNSHATESAFAEEIWLNRLQNPDVACFGLYDGEDLIGLTSILRNAEKPSEAYLTQSYIRRAYRGTGLSRLLYDARLKWARDKGLKRLIIGHRESNLASKHANQHFGFRFTHREPREWPDGGKEDMLYYELVI